MIRRLGLCIRILFGRPFLGPPLDVQEVLVSPCVTGFGAVTVTVFGHAGDLAAGAVFRLPGPVAGRLAAALGPNPGRAVPEPSRN